MSERNEELKKEERNVEEKSFKEKDTQQNINEVSSNNATDNKNEKTHKSKEEDTELNELVQKLKGMTKEELIEKFIEINKTINQKNEEIIKVKDEITQLVDKYKRALADFENLRKRTMIEKQESIKYANSAIINDFLNIFDDFERAVELARNNENLDIKNFISGIELIEKQFVELLFKKYGAKKFGEKGDKFDPQLHEALMMEEGDFEEDVVLEVFRKGYMLHDRVIRHAQVKVGKPKEKK